MISAASRPLHVVQTSYDDSVFESDAGSDTVQRQRTYAGIIGRCHPGSRWTLLTFTRRTDVSSLRIENTCFVPITGRWPGNLAALGHELARQHAQFPIDVIATQTVFDDAWAALHFSRRRRVPVVGQIHYDVFSEFARRQELGGQPWRSIRWRLAQRLMKHMQAVRVDGQRTGRWNPMSDSWEPLDGDYRAAMEQGLRIASEQAPPDLLRVPLSVPEATQ